MIDYKFKKPDLFKTALTHKSFLQNKNCTNAEYNERFEYLGDAVLDLVVSEMLFRKFHDANEGNLSKMRASLVNKNTLAQIALQINLQKKILLGKNEILSGGYENARILSSALEAIIGAVFIDGGYSAAKKLIVKLFSNLVNSMQDFQAYEQDYKTRLQEFIQSYKKTTPKYKLISESGPSHKKVFEIAVEIEDYPVVRGYGNTKKSAEQNAAEQILKLVNSLNFNNQSVSNV